MPRVNRHVRAQARQLARDRIRRFGWGPRWGTAIARQYARTWRYYVPAHENPCFSAEIEASA